MGRIRTLLLGLTMASFGMGTILRLSLGAGVILLVAGVAAVIYLGITMHRFKQAKSGTQHRATMHDIFHRIDPDRVAVVAVIYQVAHPQGMDFHTDLAMVVDRIAPPVAAVLLRGIADDVDANEAERKPADPTMN